jgi:AcrR family transcriptional regulator
VPKLWSETVETHRREVRDAILGAAATLAAERGLLSVTMSEIAERTGIGRATLYKYFPDVEAILRAWHERQVAAHLEVLGGIRERVGDAPARLGAVLEAYARLSHASHGHDSELSALLHRDEHVRGARHSVHEMLRHLLAEAAEAGDVRVDVSAAELATYCLHALDAASRLSSEAAVRRLVMVTLTGLRPSQ